MRAKITKRLLGELQASGRASGKTLFVYDTELRGFGARTGGNAISFFVEYRIGGRAGRNRRMTIGPFGPLTVEAARRKAQRLRVDIADGLDVLQARQEERRKLTGARFDEAVARYLDLKAKEGRYWEEVRRLLNSRDVQPLKARAPSTITRLELVALLDEVTARSPSTARTLFAALRPFFSWCVTRGVVDVSPLSGIRSPPPSAARDRILSDKEVRALWLATEELGMPFGPIFQLLLLTGQRRSEVAGMRWSEVDLDHAIWSIDSARTKNGLPHVVDLALPTIALLQDVPRTGNDLLFSTTGTTPVSGFSKGKARLDSLMRDHLDHDLAPWRVHDLRRTAASGMAALAVPPHVIERVLNHVSGAQGGLVGVYQRHDYRAERRAAMVAWANRITALLSPSTTTSNIVAFPSGSSASS